MAVSRPDRSRDAEARARRPDFRRGGQRPTPPPRSSAASPGRPIYFLGLLALIAVVALVLLIIWPFLQSPVPLVAVALQYHEWPLPPNSLSQEDLDACDRTFRGYQNVSFHRCDPTAFSAAWLVRQLDDIEPGGPRRLAKGRRGIIVYLSGHAVVNEQGQACLLLPGYDYADYLTADGQGKAWLPMADILQALCDAEKLRGVDKLVVLDVGKMDVNWSVGWLHNTFPSALRRAVDEIGDARLAVLCAADDGQRAWTDPALRGSVFGHFFRQGLRGAASPTDRTLTLRELAGYVHEQVSTWVADQFGAQQMPVLIAAPELDFPVAFTAPDEVARSEPWNLGSAITRWQVIWDKYAQLCEAAWAAHSGATAADGRSSISPAWSENAVEFARLQGLLVRYEQMILAGDAYRVDAEQLDTDLDKQLNAHLSRISERGGSAAMAAGGSAVLRGGEDLARAESAFRAWEAFRSQPPAEGAAAAPLPPEAQVEYAAACWFAYQQARAELASAASESWRERVARYVQFVDDQPRAASVSVEPAEMRLLRWGLTLLEDARSAQGLARAMEIRQHLEDVTAVPDPRVAYWLATRWEDLAARVRGAEDALFYARDDWAELARQWESLLEADGGGAISQCDDDGRGLEAAYAARDRARAWLPHLGIWLDYRARVARPLADTEPTALLFDMWHETVRLAGQLDQLLLRGLTLPPTEREALIPDVIATGSTVSDSIRRLLDKYNLECAALLRPGENPQWRSQMDAALRVVLPSAPRERRGDLLRAFAAAHPTTSRAQRTSAAGAARPTETPAADPTSMLPRGRHPALAILEPDEASRREAGDLATAGLVVRRHLRERNGLIQQAWAGSDAELGKTPLAVPDRVRRGWVEADALVRQSVALNWGDVSAEWDGSVLRSFDRYVQWLRFTQRRLDDFWGPWLDAAPTPFFVQACDQLLTAASAVRRTLPRQVDPVGVYQRDVEDVLRQRRGVQLLLDVAPPADRQPAGRDISGRILVRSQGVIPPGTASLFFAKPGMPPASVPAEVNGVLANRSAVELAGDVSADGIPFRLAATAHEPDLLPTLFFRGRLLTAKLPAQQELQTEVVAFRPRPRQPAKISVRGQALDASYIMFVLDCSVSMAFPGKPTESGAPRTRLEQARDELPQIVESICGTNPQARLGLILFGHREPVDTPKSKTDVETVIDFDAHARRAGDAADIRDDFARRVSQLKPTGETPLFLSILEAMRRFPRGSRPEQCHVIVLSDGVDLTGGAAHTQVAAELRGRVDVFEYELSEKEKQDSRVPPARQRLRAVCEQSGGGYYPDLTSWFDAIRSLQLRQKQFTVTGITDANWRESAGLGGVVEVGLGQLGGDFRIAVEGPEAVPVTLDGGEQLVLHYEAGQLRFAAWPEVDEKDPLLSLGGRPFRIAALSPLQEGAVRVFRVALREYEPGGAGRARFTRRPTGVWAEVEAETPDGTIVYPVTDLDYEPDHPGPVQRLSIPDWRPEVDRALIRLWFTTDAQAPRFVHDGPAPTEVIRHGTTTFTCRWDTAAEPPQFLVEAQLDPDVATSELYEYRVALAAPRVVTVEHRYIREAGQVEHVFTLEPRPQGVALEVPRLQITAKSDFVRAALDAKPVLLPVSLR